MVPLTRSVEDFILSSGGGLIGVGASLLLKGGRWPLRLLGGENKLPSLLNAGLTGGEAFIIPDTDLE